MDGRIVRDLNPGGKVIGKVGQEGIVELNEKVENGNDVEHIEKKLGPGGKLLGNKEMDENDVFIKKIEDEYLEVKGTGREFSRGKNRYKYGMKEGDEARMSLGIKNSKNIKNKRVKQISEIKKEKELMLENACKQNDKNIDRVIGTGERFNQMNEERWRGQICSEVTSNIWEMIEQQEKIKRVAIAIRTFLETSNVIIHNNDIYSKFNGEFFYMDLEKKEEKKKEEKEKERPEKYKKLLENRKVKILNTKENKEESFGHGGELITYGKKGDQEVIKILTGLEKYNDVNKESWGEKIKKAKKIVEENERNIEKFLKANLKNKSGESVRKYVRTNNEIRKQNWNNVMRAYGQAQIGLEQKIGEENWKMKFRERSKEMKLDQEFLRYTQRNQLAQKIKEDIEKLREKNDRKFLIGIDEDSKNQSKQNSLKMSDLGTENEKERERDKIEKGTKKKIEELFKGGKSIENETGLIKKIKLELIAKTRKDAKKEKGEEIGNYEKMMERKLMDSMIQAYNEGVKEGKGRMSQIGGGGQKLKTAIDKFVKNKMENGGLMVIPQYKLEKKDDEYRYEAIDAQKRMSRIAMGKNIREEAKRMVSKKIFIKDVLYRGTQQKYLEKEVIDLNRRLKNTTNKIDEIKYVGPSSYVYVVKDDLVVDIKNGKCKVVTYEDGEQRRGNMNYGIACIENKKIVIYDKGGGNNYWKD